MGKLHHKLTTSFFFSTCVKLSPSTSARAASRLVMPAGSSTASSTVFSLTARCLPTRPLAVATMLSTPSSPRLVLASTYPVPSTSSPLCVTKSAPAPTASSTTRNKSSPARKTLPITTLVVTTPSARKSSTSSSTASVSSPTTAPASRVSWYSTP